MACEAIVRWCEVCSRFGRGEEGRFRLEGAEKMTTTRRTESRRSEKAVRCATTMVAEAEAEAVRRGDSGVNIGTSGPFFR